MEERDMTDCEMLVMKIVWSDETPLSMKEITARVNQRYNKDWKTQTVSTFLARLVRKNYLTMERKGRVFFYHPAVTEEEYGKKEITKCVDFWGGGKVDALLAAFAKVRKFTKDEKKQIQKMLNDMD